MAFNASYDRAGNDTEPFRMDSRWQTSSLRLVWEVALDASKERRQTLLSEQKDALSKTIAERLTREKLYDTAALRVMSLEPVARRVVVRHEEDSMFEPQLSDLLEHWLSVLNPLQSNSHVVLVDAWARRLCEGNAIPWPRAWSLMSCSCSGWKELIELVTERAMTSVRDNDLEVPSATTVFTEMQRDQQQALTVLEDMARYGNTLQGPVRNSLVKDEVCDVNRRVLSQCPCLLSFSISEYGRAAGTEGPGLDALMTELVSMFNQCQPIDRRGKEVDSGASSQLGFSSLPSSSRFSLFGHSKRKRVPFLGTEVRVVARVLTGSSFDDQRWQQTVLEGESEDGGLIMTALVFLDADNSVAPRVHFRPDSLPDIPRGHMKPPSVTGYAKRAVVFPHKLQYQVESSSEVTTVLIVDLFDPNVVSQSASACAIKPSLMVISPSDTSSLEERRWHHQVYHNMPHQAQTPTDVSRPAVSTNTLPLRTRFSLLPAERSQLETEIHCGLMPLLDQPRWWMSNWKRVVDLRRKYVKARLLEECAQCLCILDKHTGSDGTTRQALIESYAPWLRWFDSLVTHSYEAYTDFYQPTPVHRNEMSMAMSFMYPHRNGMRVSMSFMSPYEDLSVEEIRYAYVKTNQVEPDQDVEVGDESIRRVIAARASVDPFSTFSWLLVYRASCHPALSDEDRVIFTMPSADLCGQLVSLALTQLSSATKLSKEDSIALVSSILGSDSLTPRLAEQFIVQLSRIGEAAARWEENILTRLEHAVSIANDTLRLPDSNDPGAVMTDGAVADCCVCDDMLMPSVKARLQERVSALSISSRRVSEDGMANKLVDPGLYAYLPSRTAYLPRFGLTRARSMKEIPKHLSKVLNYEGKASEPVRHEESLWIPSDVVIRLDGRVEFLSYINNLHPVRYKQLYESIADVFTAFVPLFERVLTYVTGPWSSGSGLFGLHPLEAKLTTGEKVLKTLYPLRGVIQAVIAIEEVQIHPDSISLPDAPSDSWVRDSVHNSIVATGVYVLHCTNLSDASLSFRRMARRPMAPGIRQSEIDEELGAIRCLEGRGVVFPAYYGHKATSPLQLLDPTKPGSMQVLVIHVLNPSQPVVSSAEVPPQQREWRFDEIITPIARRYALPEDVQKRLETMIPGGFTSEEAIQLRGRVAPSTWFG